MKYFCRLALIGLLLNLILGEGHSIQVMARPLQGLLMAQIADLEEAKQLLQQAQELYSQGKYTEAIPLAERAVMISRGRLNSKDYKLATYLNNLAVLYQTQGRYSEAEPLFKEVVEIVRIALPQNHFSVAMHLNSLALLYRDQGRYSEAEPLFKEAVEIDRIALTPNHHLLAAHLSNLALIYQAQGRYPEAEPLFKEAVEIARIALTPNHPGVAMLLNNLAVLYQVQGRYPEAEPLFKEALKIARIALPKNHPKLTMFLNNLGKLYQDQGRYPEAEPLFKEALKIARIALPKNHPELAILLNNLGKLYQDQGRYPEAEPLFEEALKIARIALSPNHHNLATYLNNLGELYQVQGRYTEAESLFEEALKIARIALSPNHHNLATYLNNLALLYKDQGRYTEAESRFKEALKITRIALSPNHHNLATYLNNLALLYKDQGRYTEAESRFKEALKITRIALPKNHPELATYLNNLALLYKDQGRYTEAESRFKEALKIARIALPKNHPELATYLNNLVALYWAQNDLHTTLQYLHEGLEIEEYNLSRNLTVGNEQQKKAFLSRYQGSTDLAISFHQQSDPQNLDTAQLAFTTLLRRKGRLLDVLGQSFQHLRNSPDDEVSKKLSQLIDTQNQLSTLTTRGPGNYPNQYQETLQKLTKNEKQLTTELSQMIAGLAEVYQPVTIPQIKAALPQNAALVEFIEYKPFDPKAKHGQRLGKPRYAVYVLLPSGQLQWGDLGSVAEIQPLLSDFITRVQIESENKDSLQTLALPLYNKIFRPIRHMVGNRKHLLLAPDGELNRIPFEALMDEQGQYLIQNFQFTYLSSGRDLMRLENLQKLDNLPQAQFPLLLAAPDFETKNLNPQNLKVASVQKTTQANSVRSRGSNTHSAEYAKISFLPLKGARAEGKAIEAGGYFDFQAVYGENATESILKRWANPYILHIATHGIFLEKNDIRTQSPSNASNAQFNSHLNQVVLSEKPLLRSGLVFAGFNKKEKDPTGDDGLLTALEVSRLDLRATQMVVMSACKTGVGDIQSGDGVYGLRRAFTLAGARSQVMSLWDVQDASTKELMVAYYALLDQGKGRGEALRQVQLDMLEGKFDDKENGINYKTPFYWAPFIRTGDWRPLKAL
ncbi:CHAT domain-containing protein [Acaryochloris sp. IP29b_bin.137]|uniref:CHAT domain-containing protein n=1 Tax=Acaryochloris sp. IP29b_bin.137 TaxID=2969217 RepID=UPI0026311D85|nr:CHAT domain-containing protein [Acaryochloris sp. IP29b_bin.137]